MLRIRLLSPDGEHTLRTFDCPAAAMSIGRAADNDLRIDQPTVSSQHLQVMTGLVVADCGSLNGTFVAGERIKGAALIESGQVVELGGTGTRLTIEQVPDAEPSAPPRPGGTVIARPIRRAETSRSEPSDPSSTASIALGDGAREATAAPASMPVATGPSDAGALSSDDRSARLADLERRNATLERELALARERLAEARRELDAARDDPRLPAPGPSLPAPGAPAEDAAAGGLFAQLQQQIRRQQEHIRTLERERSELGAGGIVPAVDVERQERLERENAELQRRLAAAHEELERRSAGDAGTAGATERPPSGASAARVEALERELEQERTRSRDLVQRLRVAQAAAVRTPDGRAAATDAGAAVPGAGLAAAPAGGHAAGSDASGVRGLWELFAHREIEGREPLLHAPAEDFLTLETLRLVRKIERVSTRLAQDSIGTLPRDTYLPGQSTNLRSLAARVLADAADGEARREYKSHASELTHWLLVSLASHRKAAEQLVAEVRDRLSERALTENAPLGARARLVGKETELWRRANQALAELTPAFVEDRLEELARREAGSLLASEA